MKKYLKIMIFFPMLSILLFNVENAKGSTHAMEITTSRSYAKKNIKVKVKFVSKKRIKIKFTNKGNKDFYFYGGFKLKKFVNKKWKKVQFNEDIAKFPKTMIVWKNGSITVKRNWKNYFSNNLSKGRYKLKWVKTKRIDIK